MHERKSCLLNQKIYFVILEVTLLHTTVDEQVEKVQSKLDKKDETVKELDSQVKGIVQDGQWMNDNTVSPNTCCCQWNFFIIIIFYYICNKYIDTITFSMLFVIHETIIPIFDIELQSLHSIVVNRTAQMETKLNSMNLQLEEFKKIEELRISSSHDSKVIKYHKHVGVSG